MSNLGQPAADGEQSFNQFSSELRREIRLRRRRRESCRDIDGGVQGPPKSLDSQRRSICPAGQTATFKFRSDARRC
jgi:hypothetical protein